VKSILIISFLLLVGSYGFGQEIKTIEVFKYEELVNDSTISDTSLYKSEHFDKDGFKYKSTTYYNDTIIQEEQFFGDSLRYNYYDTKLFPNNRVEYRYDAFGSVISIISRDTTRYKNIYKDSLLIKSISGKNKKKISESFYNSYGKILRNIQYTEGLSDTIEARWQYDKKNRILKWDSHYGTIATFEYKKNPKTEIMSYSSKEDGEVYEKTITYYIENSDVIKSTEWYRMGKLKYRAVYKYTYY